MSVKTEQFYEKVKGILNKLWHADWKDPLNLLLLATVVIAPFVAKIYVMTGLLLGLLLTISTMWTLSKSPIWLRKLVIKYPVASDFILSTLAMVGVGGLFGSGLTLGIGAVICGILLGYCIPHINLEPAFH